MAATADPRAKPPTAHHLEPWARQPRAHRVRVPAHPAVDEPGASADRDRRRPSPHSHRRSAGGGDEPRDGGIEDLRARLMGHLRDAAGRLRVVPQPSPPPPPPKATEPEPGIILAPPSAQQQQEADVADKPWKLRERTRRRPAALKSWPVAPSPPSRKRRKRAPFSVALAPEEIEDDIYALTGGRPRRRPRKRPRAVQRQLDSLFPGLWLTEITADDYKVAAEE